MYQFRTVSLISKCNCSSIETDNQKNKSPIRDCVAHEPNSSLRRSDDFDLCPPFTQKCYVILSRVKSLSSPGHMVMPIILVGRNKMPQLRFHGRCIEPCDVGFTFLRGSSYEKYYLSNRVRHQHARYHRNGLCRKHSFRHEALPL